MRTQKQLELFSFNTPQKMRWYEHKITISLDKLILFSAIFPLLLIFSYSLGMKRAEQQQTNIRREKDIVTNLKEDKKLRENTLLETEEPVSYSKKISLSKSGDFSPDKKRGNAYVIQVATYLKKDFAQREKEYLEKNGYQAMITKKGKYLVLSIVNFSSKEEAKKALNFLRNRYKDCFIRR